MRIEVTRISLEENLGMLCVDEVIVMRIPNGLSHTCGADSFTRSYCVFCCVCFDLRVTGTGIPFKHDLRGSEDRGEGEHSVLVSRSIPCCDFSL